MSSSHPIAVTLTLTSMNDIADVRRLTLTTDHSVTIGRASKSALTGATPNNALFDCPIVTRAHAELRVTDLKHVTITDMSRHGTSVNGRRLTPYQPFTLGSGDVIALGENVVVGSNTHSGVKISYHCLSATPTTPLARPNRSFSFSARAEDSDSNGEKDSIASDNDNEHDPISSEHTTPDQAVFGSQKRPIDLEDTSTFTPGSTGRNWNVFSSSNPRPIVILDDADEPVSRLAENELAANGNAISLDDDEDDDDDEEEEDEGEYDDEEDVEDNFHVHNDDESTVSDDESVGSPRFAWVNESACPDCHGDHAHDQESLNEDDQSVGNDPAEEEYEPGFEAEDVDELVMMTFGNNQTIDDEASQHDDDQEESDDEGPEVMSSTLPEHTHTSTRYDPVRGFQPPHEPVQYGLASMGDQAQSFGNYSRFNGPYPRSGSRVTPLDEYSMRPPFDPYGREMPAWTPAPGAVGYNEIPFATSGQQHWASFPPLGTTTTVSSPPAANKISIKDIVDYNSERNTPMVAEGSAAAREHILGVLNEASSGSKKRKADEMEKDEAVAPEADVETATSAPAASMPEAAEPIAPVVAPLTKRTKTEDVSRGRYYRGLAAGLVLGAGAYHSFLTSSFSEKVIEYFL